MQAALAFAETRLKDYDTLRNNPNKDACSNLSPYYHFGQVSLLLTMAEGVALTMPACIPDQRTAHNPRAPGQIRQQALQGSPSLCGGDHHPPGAGRQLLLLQQAVRLHCRGGRLGQGNTPGPHHGRAVRACMMAWRREGAATMGIYHCVRAGSTCTRAPSWSGVRAMTTYGTLLSCRWWRMVGDPSPSPVRLRP